MGAVAVGALLHVACLRLLLGQCVGNQRRIVQHPLDSLPDFGLNLFGQHAADRMRGDHIDVVPLRVAAPIPRLAVLVRFRRHRPTALATPQAAIDELILVFAIPGALALALGTQGLHGVPGLLVYDGRNLHRDPLFPWPSLMVGLAVGIVFAWDVAGFIVKLDACIRLTGQDMPYGALVPEGCLVFPMARWWRGNALLL